MSRNQLLTEKQSEIFMANTGRKVNMLNYSEMYKLLRYIELNQGELKGKTQITIANEVTEKTGVTVTVSNIRAASETLGIPLGLIVAKKPNLEGSVDRALARALCDLYRRIGEVAPDYVTAIAQ